MSATTPVPAAVLHSSPATPGSSAKRALEPADRVAEILFGLIMVLTFTGSLSVADAGRDDVGPMLIGALGCNFAWGVIDGLFYLMAVLAEKARDVATFRGVAQAPDVEHVRRVVARVLPPSVAELLEDEQLEHLRTHTASAHSPPDARLTGDDWRGAVAVFLLVFLATFPVAVPFIVMQQVALAMRVSNAIAVAMLFVAGFAYGKVVHRSPLMVGLGMVVIGVVIVAFTIALGG